MEEGRPFVRRLFEFIGRYLARARGKSSINRSRLAGKDRLSGVRGDDASKLSKVSHLIYTTSLNQE